MSYNESLQLIDAYFDDELSNADLCLVEEMLVENQAFFELFMRESRFFLQISMGLSEDSQTELTIDNLNKAVILEQQLSQEQPLAPTFDLETEGNFGDVLRTIIVNVICSTKYLWTITLFSAGLFLLMMFMLTPKICVNNPPAFNTATHVSQTVDAVWGEEVKEDDLKTLPMGTKLELKAGLAQVEYKNGIRVNLEGPAVFIVSDENEGTLLSGKISARMAGKRGKFIVTTPIGKIMDLGTEFGIVVDEQKNTEVQVFEGKVRLAVFGKNENAQPTETLDLVEADAVRIDSVERTASEIHYKPLGFARSYRDLRPYYYDDFSTDTLDNYYTSFANGRANDHAFSIESGVLSIYADPESRSLISKNPLLGAGEIFMVDVPSVDPEISEISITVSAQPSQLKKGKGGNFGFRLRRGKGIVLEVFGSSKNPPNADLSRGTEAMRIDDPFSGKPIRLVIERHKSNAFVFYYELNDERIQMGRPVSNSDLKNFKRFYVGVEARSANRNDIKIFDNFTVYPVDKPRK